MKILSWCVSGSLLVSTDPIRRIFCGKPSVNLKWFAGWDFGSDQMKYMGGLGKFRVRHRNRPTNKSDIDQNQQINKKYSSEIYISNDLSKCSLSKHYSEIWCPFTTNYSSAAESSPRMRGLPENLWSPKEQDLALDWDSVLSTYTDPRQRSWMESNHLFALCTSAIDSTASKSFKKAHRSRKTETWFICMMNAGNILVYYSWVIFLNVFTDRFSRRVHMRVYITISWEKTPFKIQLYSYRTRFDGNAKCFHNIYLKISPVVSGQILCLPVKISLLFDQITVYLPKPRNPLNIHQSFYVFSKLALSISETTRDMSTSKWRWRCIHT